jgi:hypothetical protein
MKTAFWNVAYGLFFLVLVFTGVGHLISYGLLPKGIALGDFLLMALAIFRLTRLTSYDIITAFIREGVKDAPKGSFVGTFSDLVHCPWCTGLWFSFFVVFFYYATPIAWPVILILALAGVASIFQILANLIGWSAEFKKRAVLGSEEKSRSTCG